MNYKVDLLSMCKKFLESPSSGGVVYSQSAEHFRRGIYCDPSIPGPQGKPIPSNPSKSSKPIAITTPDFILGYKPTNDVKKIEGAIANNKKEFNQLSKQIDNGIIVNQNNNKVYSVDDGKKKVIAKNQTGEPLTSDVFGKNIQEVAPLTTGNKTTTNKTIAIKNNNKTQGFNVNRLLRRIDILETTVQSLK